MLDLVIHNFHTTAEIPTTDAVIGIHDGRIVQITTADSPLPNAHTVVDAKGSLLLPGLIETHIHLEKAMLLTRMPRDASSLQEAITMTAQLKQHFTKEDIQLRSLEVINRAIAYGVSHMRCHVEVDPIMGLLAMESIMELKQQMKHAIDLQIVAFPQEGIYRAPGTAELLEEAMRMGADVVGGITYMDEDLEAHLNYVFKLAEKYDKPLDFHADFSLNPDELHILRLAEKTIERGLQGKVSAGHVTSLATLPLARAEEVADFIAEARLNIMSLPAPDLYLNGREDSNNVRRGITPVGLLIDRGVNVVFGTNNIRNAFTPFGTADPLDIALLLAQTSHMGSEADAQQLIKMATTNAALALGISPYGIQVGAPADLSLLSVPTVRDALIERPNRTAVWKNGQLISPQ